MFREGFGLLRLPYNKDFHFMLLFPQERNIKRLLCALAISDSSGLDTAETEPNLKEKVCL